jgi:ABC-2 type transport system ATP-binding protein
MSQRNQSNGSRTESMGNPILQTYNLSKQYGNVLAVDNVSITVNEGDVYGLLGPNGAGKTTMIAMMLGLVYPTQGRVQIAGHFVHTERRQALQTVGAMIESPAFYPYLSGRDNLKIIGNLRGKLTSQDLEEILTLVGLSEHQHKRFSNYSLGMKQRLAIGLTLLHQPKLLILDEPTNGLDPRGTVEIRNLILYLAKQGHTIILCSHLLHEVEQVCDRLAILNRGRLITEGAIEIVNSACSLEETFLALTEV